MKKKQHLPNRAIYLTRASSYCMNHGKLKGLVSPVKLRLLCDALLQLHPELNKFGSLKKKETCWEFVYFACEELKINTQRNEVKEKKFVAKAPLKMEEVKTPFVDFYYSKEWRALRYRVLREYGARCQCCGATPETSKQVHVDHIKPRSKFPHLELEFSNLQVLCEDCNLGKSNIDDTDWRPNVTEELDILAAEHIRTIQ